MGSVTDYYLQVELVIGANVADRVWYFIPRHCDQPYINIFPSGPYKIRHARVQKNMAILKSTVKPAFGRGRGGASGRDRGGHGGNAFGRARVTGDVDEELAACFGGLRM